MSDQPITFERLIDATPEEAFALFTQPERLRRWQVVSAAVDLSVGGDYRWTVTPGHIAVGTFTEIDPGRRVVYTWGWEGSDSPAPGSSTIVVELEPVGDKTLVRLTHDGLSAEQALGHTEGWTHFLERLEEAAISGDAGPDPWAGGGDDLDQLSAAEASWALCHQVMVDLTPEHLDMPTPCSEFTVDELVEHLMGSLRALGGMAGAEIPDDVQADSTEDYVARAAEATLAAWRARGLEGEVAFGEGNAPAALPAGIVAIEFFVHAWDIARATGRPFETTDELTEYVAGLADQIIQPDNRGAGRGFDAIAVPSHDDPVSRLMAFTGRAT